jgi:hypothetical protein
MNSNEASWDRIARVVIGIGLIGGGILGVTGVWGWVMAAIGLVLLVTGLIGWCPIYSILRTGTKTETPSQPTSV